MITFISMEPINHTKPLQEHKGWEAIEISKQKLQAIIDAGYPLLNKLFVKLLNKL